MRCVWTLPAQPPDRAALERMRRHFPKPDELMPEAWFLGEVLFYGWLAEKSPEELALHALEHAFLEIGTGVGYFPWTSYVPTWKAWFRYLLPYAIARAHESSILLPYVITALMWIYPQDITAEYEGFRDDVVAALGSQAIPQTLARDQPRPDREDIPAINDIWDFSFWFAERPYEVLSQSLLFNLKYLRPPEIEEWAASLLRIDNAQFRLEFILWWLAYHEFSIQARDWTAGTDLNALLEHTGLLDRLYRMPPFQSLDDLIPPPNWLTFQKVLVRGLSQDTIQDWSADILSKAGYLADSLEWVLLDFEWCFLDVASKSVD